MISSVRQRHFVRFQLPVIMWAVLIFISSSIPGNDFPEVRIPMADKIVHFIIFFIFCALTHRAVKHQTQFPFFARHHFLSSVLLTVTYGMIDEAHQLFVPIRDSSLRDLLADALGAFLYVTVVWTWTKVRTEKVASHGSDAG